MARISEFNQFNADRFEIAITATEFASLSTGSSYSMEFFTSSGGLIAGQTVNLPNDSASWTYDADTDEYVYSFSTPFSFNHHSQYYGFALIENDGTTQSVSDAKIISQYNNNTTLSTTITEPGFMNGYAFDDIIIQTGANRPASGESIIWNAPDINNYIFGAADFGNSGSAPVICFVNGTFIATECGEMLVEDLKIGDLVYTIGGELKPIRWIGKRDVTSQELAQNEKLRPIKFAVGSMGESIPKRDLWLSRQHRVLVTSKVASRMYNEGSVLVPAIKMISFENISIDESMKPVSYFHILLEDHDVVLVENMGCESLYLGDNALKAMSKHAQEELAMLFPEVLDKDFQPIPAFPLAEGKKLSRLVKRMQKNDN